VEKQRTGRKTREEELEVNTLRAKITAAALIPACNLIANYTLDCFRRLSEVCLQYSWPQGHSVSYLVADLKPSRQPVLQK